MATVAEQARITRRGEDETIPDAPPRPARDYPAAARFLWEYLRREGRRAGAQETHKGRPGWLWEGTVSAAVRFLWPGIGDVSTENAIRAIGRMLRENGSLVVLQAGRGQTLSVVWVSEEYAPGRPPSTRPPKAAAPTRPAPAPRPAPVDEQPAAAVDVDQVDVSGVDQVRGSVTVPGLPVDEAPPAAPEAPQDVDEAPAVPEVPDAAPAAAEAPTRPRYSTAGQDVDELPAAAAAAGDELATILASRERDLVALMRRLDQRELELVDRELALVERELEQLHRERAALVARRRRLAGAPDSMS